MTSIVTDRLCGSIPMTTRPDWVIAVGCLPVNVHRQLPSVFTSLVGVATDRGAPVLVLLPAFMAGQQVIQPMDGPVEGRVHAVCVVGHGDRGLTLRSRLDH